MHADGWPMNGITSVVCMSEIITGKLLISSTNLISNFCSKVIQSINFLNSQGNAGQFVRNSERQLMTTTGNSFYIRDEWGTEVWDEITVLCLQQHNVYGSVAQIVQPSNAKALS